MFPCFLLFIHSSISPCVSILCHLPMLNLSREEAMALILAIVPRPSCHMYNMEKLKIENNMTRYKWTVNITSKDWQQARSRRHIWEANIKRWKNSSLSICTTKARDKSVGDSLQPTFIVDMAPDWLNGPCEPIPETASFSWILSWILYSTLSVHDQSYHAYTIGCHISTIIDIKILSGYCWTKMK